MTFYDFANFVITIIKNDLIDTLVELDFIHYLVFKYKKRSLFTFLFMDFKKGGKIR